MNRHYYNGATCFRGHCDCACGGCNTSDEWLWMDLILRIWTPACLLILAAALQFALSGCAALRHTTVAIVRPDVDAALASAIAAGEHTGILCHQQTEAALDIIEKFPDPRVIGVASLAEAKRIKQQEIEKLRPVLAILTDLCAPVYRVMGVLRPLLAGWGL